MVKIGIIGLGKMGMLHAATLNSFKDVKLTAVSDTSDFVKNALMDLKPELPFYKDYLDMLKNEKLDGVFITTPIHLHVPIGIECANRGIPVFFEKPLSLNAKEAKEMVGIFNKSNIISLIGYGGRYYDIYLKAKEIIDTGCLGKILNFSSNFYVSQLFKKQKGWRYTKEQSGGGVLNNLSSHLINTLYWFFGEVESVSAVAQNWYSEEVEDYFHAMIQFQNGISGWVDSSWSVDNYRLPRATIEINSHNGKLIITDDYIKLFLKSSTKEFSDGWTNFMFPEIYKGAEFNLAGAQFTREDRDFIEAIKSGKQPEMDINWALKIQEIIDAIYQSSEERSKRIYLKENQI